MIKEAFPPMCHYDSLDRSLVVEACRLRGAPVRTLKELVPTTPNCTKCMACQTSDGGWWVNVMMFGFGVAGCHHHQAAWAPAEEAKEPYRRMRDFVIPVLNMVLRGRQATMAHHTRQARSGGIHAACITHTLT